VANPSLEEAVVEAEAEAEAVVEAGF